MRQKGIICGKVVDAETGKLIKRFRVKPGYCRKLQEGDIPTSRIHATLYKTGNTFYTHNGIFEIREFQPGVAASITVSTEEYAPFELERAVATESKTEPFIFKLQKSLPIRGGVLDATTSQPIESATLFFFDGKQPIDIRPYQAAWRANEIGRTYSRD